VIIDETTITSAGGADHVFVAKFDRLALPLVSELDS
jgi:hypothetical protein